MDRNLVIRSFGSGFKPNTDMTNFAGTIWQLLLEKWSLASHLGNQFRPLSERYINEGFNNPELTSRVTTDNG